MPLDGGDLSEQQERFCQFMVQGKTQRDAYRLAGYKTATDEATDAAASRLLSNGKIEARIAKLREKGAKRAEVTLEWLITQAQEVLEAAKSDASHAASIAAIKELGVLSGKRVEKQETELSGKNGGPIATIDAKKLSKAQLEALASIRIPTDAG
jgi:phage terminase small subunit